uniref:Reduced growth phenotype protein 1 n=2 Tax=Kalanchoe fedtschenkoi TaxID=63787 RepID=A0A7N0VEP1_KALFE
MPLPEVTRSFSFFGFREPRKIEDSKPELLPSLILKTDKDVYRPGETVEVTIEISNQASDGSSLLVERLAFDLKGIQKLDLQWFNTPKPLPGFKQRRGEHLFMDGSAPSLVSNQIVSSGVTKSYVVRTMLPSVIPPSYRGATIRYLYHVRSTLSGKWLMLENENSRRDSIKDFNELEARIPLHVWVTQKFNGLQTDDSWSEGIVPAITLQMDLYMKEIDSDSDWVRANDLSDGPEDGYESSRDDTSSISSFNMKDPIHKTFGSSLSLQSSVAQSSFKDGPYLESGRPSFSSHVAPPRLSVAEVLQDSSADVLSTHYSAATISPSLRKKNSHSFTANEDDDGGPSVPETSEPAASEGFTRGRSYNIRLDDQVLLRFCPKNSDSTYYFSDWIGGTLTFFHEEGARRCLEVSVTLEMSETINRRFVHPSRRNSLTITKIQSDHHQVVADLLQTSFLFSIPSDGPMSFSTPHVSVQWFLRFEFFTTPKNVDWTRYEHPLMIEGRDKTEWLLPITVYAPPPAASTTHVRNNKSLFMEPLWVRS